MIAIMMCDDCDVQMEEVFSAEHNFHLKGWLCPQCRHFAPTIGREKWFTMDDKDDRNQTDDSR